MHTHFSRWDFIRAKFLFNTVNSQQLDIDRPSCLTETLLIGGENLIYKYPQTFEHFGKLS